MWKELWFNLKVEISSSDKNNYLYPHPSSIIFYLNSSTYWNACLITDPDPSVPKIYG